MNYHGTDGDDVLDQATLGLPNWSIIYGGKGNDRITIGVGTAAGEAGNDTIIGTSSSSAVVFWSPSAVIVNLGTGIAQDGYGFVDTLINIHTVQGTVFDDQFIGSTGNDEFWGLGGNDTFSGGGGQDAVVFWDTKFEDSQVAYNSVNDTFTVKKNTTWGDKGTDILTGIHTLTFAAPSNYNIQITKFDIGGFLKTLQQPIALSNGAWNAGLKVGDFNGDGHADLMVVQQVGSGSTDVPYLILEGNGIGGFTDASSEIFQSGTGSVNAGAGRNLVADFNNDGVSDFFTLCSGNDAPPFPGGRNQLYLSSSSDGKLADVSASLIQRSEFNHGGCVGDVNADGYLDIVVNTLSNGNKLLLNDKTGHFIDRSDLLPHPTFVQGVSTFLQSNTYSGMVDVNGDGCVDLILGKWDADGSTPLSQVLLNDGSGNFTRTSPIALPLSGVYKDIVLDVKPIDLNGDSLPDLVLSITSGGEANTVTGLISDTYYRTPYIQLLVNDGGGKFHDETSLRLPQKLAGESSWIFSLTVTDFNHDGYPDLLATSAGAIPSVVYLNRGNGSFDEGWESVSDGRTVALDVNSDGMIDLATSNYLGLAINQNSLANGHIYKANFGGDDLFGSSGADTFYPRDGVDNIDGGAGFDTVIFNGPSSNYQLGFSNGAWTVRDKTGANGTDTVTNVERLQFANKTVITDSTIPGSYTDLPESLWHFCIVAFSAAPGVEYMNQMADAFRGGLSVQTIVDVFTSKSQFTDVYPTSLSHLNMATALVNNVVKGSASAAVKQGAITDIVGALDAGWTVGKMIYTVFGNLANQPQTDATWGNTAHQFQNEMAVAKHFTSVMDQSTTDMITLREVLAPVTESTDVSTPAEIATLIGVALMA